MIELHEDDVLHVGDKTYRLLQEPKQNYREISKFSTWSTVVKEEGTKEDEGIYFLKYADYKETQAVKLLKREGEFRMYYPFIEHIYHSFLTEDEHGNTIIGILAEYIDGVDLLTYREEVEKVLDEERMFRYMMQLLRGVQYYLEFSKRDPFVHRDLKPENIMVSRKYDKIVISDFDWAHIPESKGTEEYQVTIGGTKGYSDPRAFQINKTKSDVKMDIYSLGRIFCFWIRGRDYFIGDDEKKRYIKEGEDDFAYGLEWNKIPPKYQDEEYRPFRDIIAKMVARPEERYSSISEILKDMKKFLIEYYGNKEIYEEIFNEPSLLTIPEDRYVKNDVVFGYCFSSTGRRKQCPAQNGRLSDVIAEQDGLPLMTLYCLENKLYYIPIHPELKKEYEDGSYRIKDGDLFLFRDDEIDFMVY